MVCSVFVAMNPLPPSILERSHQPQRNLICLEVMPHFFHHIHTPRKSFPMFFWPCLFSAFSVNRICILEELPSFTLYDVLKMHLCHSHYLHLIPLPCQILFHCMDIPHLFTCSLIDRQSSLPCLAFLTTPSPPLLVQSKKPIIAS